MKGFVSTEIPGKRHRKAHLVDRRGRILGRPLSGGSLDPGVADPGEAPFVALWSDGFSP